jgi:acyl-CoA thioesterase-1
LLALATFAPKGYALAQREPGDNMLVGVHRIVTLGDSITEAGGQPGGYVWWMARYLRAVYPSQNIEVVNAGISGHKSTDMQARFQRDVLDKKPDLVTISVGVNDVWHAFRDFEHGVDHPKGDLPAGLPCSPSSCNRWSMPRRRRG